jgi:antitoxin PrlF
MRWLAEASRVRTPRTYMSEGAVDADQCKEFPYILHRDDVIRQVDNYEQADQQSANDVPAPVRTALRLKAGDELVYSIEGERVILTKGDRRPVEDPFATFDEWSSEADRQAYADL